MDYSFAVVPPAYPVLYKILLDKPNELQTLYSDAILPEIPISEVESQMAKYVTSFIEPVGWQGIWRASPRSSGLTFKADFLVDVIDVRRNSLEALVIIQKVLDSQLDESNVEDENDNQEQLDKLIQNNRILNAPLIEMYVVREGDEKEAFLKTAVVIEHARFFYKYLWRPWDTLSNVTQLAEIFAETCLQPRLNLYIDMKQNNLSNSMKQRIKQILTEGWQLRHLLDDIYKRQEGDEDDEEGDHFADLALDEADMFEAIRLKIKLEDLDREMRMFEEPYLRMFTYCLRSSSAEEEESKIELESSAKVLHIVSKQYDLQVLNMITSFYAKKEKDHQNKLLFHNSINAAIKAAKNGHKIAVLPGLYQCTSLEWIENDIEIEGLNEDFSKTIFQCSSDIDIFLHCSGNVTLRNLTLTSQKSLDSILMVHTGTVTLFNCRLDASACTKSSFVVLSRAKLRLEKTFEIKPTKETKEDEEIKKDNDNDLNCSAMNSSKIANEINQMDLSSTDSSMQTPSESPEPSQKQKTQETNESLNFEASM